MPDMDTVIPRLQRRGWRDTKGRLHKGSSPEKIRSANEHFAVSLEKFRAEAKKAEKVEEFRLYHYAPPESSIDKAGLLSPSRLVEQGVDVGKLTDKYRRRTAAFLSKKEQDVTAKDTLKYLEGIRGEGGSRMFSLLPTPVPADAHDDLTAYHNAKKLYSVDLYALQRAGLVERAQLVGSPGSHPFDVPVKDIPQTLRKETKKADWKESPKGGLLFRNHPHIALQVRGGHIPRRFLRVETKTDSRKTESELDKPPHKRTMASFTVRDMTLEDVERFELPRIRMAGPGRHFKGDPWDYKIALTAEGGIAGFAAYHKGEKELKQLWVQPPYRRREWPALSSRP